MLRRVLEPPPDPRATLDVDLSSMAALTFLVWDILITLDEEVIAIWSKPYWFYSKWLFLFVRYFAVAMQIALLFVGSRFAPRFDYAESDCVKWYVFQEAGTQLLVAAVEIILMLRVHALYDRSRRIALLLIFLFVAENLVMSVTLARAAHHARFDTGCAVVHTPRGLAAFAVAFAAFESVLCGLTLAKFAAALRTGWARAPVLRRAVRDGTWAFALVFVTLCVNAGFFLGKHNSPRAALAFPWLLSVEAAAGARVVLGLAELHSDAPSERTVSARIVFTRGWTGASEGYEMAAGVEVDHFGRLSVEGRSARTDAGGSTCGVPAAILGFSTMTGSSNMRMRMRSQKCHLSGLRQQTRFLCADASNVCAFWARGKAGFGLAHTTGLKGGDRTTFGTTCSEPLWWTELTFAYLVCFELP
ncbi:hypothetical protein BC834DRAFT_967211 [Gloeopeniophorella convolvens]|nr:hypothetical protein BC834DRAFT_967211 [Gloeopeniophorella convolvens]